MYILKGLFKGPKFGTFPYKMHWGNIDQFFWVIAVEIEGGGEEQNELYFYLRDKNCNKNTYNKKRVIILLFCGIHLDKDMILLEHARSIYFYLINN